MSDLINDMRSTVPLLEAFRAQCEVAARLGEDPMDVYHLWHFQWAVEPADVLLRIAEEVKG